MPRPRNCGENRHIPVSGLRRWKPAVRGAWTRLALMISMLFLAACGSETARVVALAEVHEAYEAGNDAAADKRFKGQRIEVSGRVERVRSDVEGTVLFLEETHGVTFFFFNEAEAGSLSRLKVGDAVRVRGRFMGRMAADEPGKLVVKDCVVVPG